MFALTPWREKEMTAFPLPRLGNEFNTLFNRVFGGWPMLFERHLEPEHFWGLEVNEVEKEVIVRAEIPGFEAPEIELELRNNRLIVKAEKKHEVAEKGYEYAERRFERFVELPVEVEPAKVEATYRNGVLEVHLPKTEAAAGRRIPVT
jgi:HSP20 family protein